MAGFTVTRRGLTDERSRLPSSSPLPSTVITEATAGINLLDGTVTIDATGVTPCDAAFDAQLLRARQAGIPLLVPGGSYKRATPLLLVSGDSLIFEAGWINTTILFAFSSPNAAIQALDPTDATTDVRFEGSVQITGDSANTTVGVFVATGQKWEWDAIRVGRGFTQSSMVFYGQRWRDEAETSAGVASASPPKGILTAAVGVADATVSLTNTIQYQTPNRWPWGYAIAKLITPKTTLSANLIGAARTVVVQDGTKLTSSGAIMLAGTGEIIFYTGKTGNTLTGCIRNYYGHISTVVSGVLIYQVELISYTGYSGGQLTGVTRGLRGTTAIAHGADIAAPVLAGSPHAGGALTGTNFFVLEALNGVLQSIASNEVSVTYGGGNLSAGLSWGAVTGATGYRLHVSTASGIYRGSIDVGNVTSFTYTGQSTTNTGTPFGVYQNPGSTTRNTFGKIDAEAGTYPMVWTGTTGLDVAQTTTLSGNGGGITSGTTTINFAGAGPLNAYAGVDGPAGTTLVFINGEIIQGTVSGSSLVSCQRGLYLTTAASHTDGDGVYAVFRRNGGDANQTTIDDLLIASNLTVSVACWFMQGAGNTIGNSNASATNPGTPGDCYRFDWYSNTLVSAITGPTGTAAYEFNFNDAGELSGDNLVLNHDVEGGSPSNYGAAVIFDPAGRNTVVGYRNGIKLRRITSAAGLTWQAGNDLLWNNNGVPTWRNPSGVDAQVLTGEGAVTALNVKDFGAKGDGSTDDSAAILSALAVGTHESLYFPEGTYVMALGAIGSAAANGGRSIRFLGSHPYRTLFQPLNQTNPCFVIQGSGDTTDDLFEMWNIGLSVPSSRNYDKPVIDVRLVRGWRIHNARADVSTLNSGTLFKFGSAYEGEFSGTCKLRTGKYVVPVEIVNDQALPSTPGVAPQMDTMRFGGLSIVGVLPVVVANSARSPGGVTANEIHGLDFTKFKHVATTYYTAANSPSFETTLNGATLAGATSIVVTSAGTPGSAQTGISVGDALTIGWGDTVDFMQVTAIASTTITAHALGPLVRAHASGEPVVVGGANLALGSNIHSVILGPGHHVEGNLLGVLCDSVQGITALGGYHGSGEYIRVGGNVQRIRVYSLHSRGTTAKHTVIQRGGAWVSTVSDADWQVEGVTVASDAPLPITLIPHNTKPWITRYNSNNQPTETSNVNTGQETTARIIAQINGTEAYRRTNGGVVQAQGLGSKRKIVTGTTTLSATDATLVAITTNAGAFAITLPAANAVLAGVVYTFKDEVGNAGTNAVTITRAGADTIDGATTKALNANFGSARIYSDGVSKWFAI